MKNLKKEHTQSLVHKAAVWFIRLYQAILSPDTGLLRSLFGSLFFVSPNSGCRFVPSCSDYAHESISQYGLLFGFVMFLRRVLRCHPFSRGGFDPVNVPISAQEK